jgi:large subunit ribosomal protein L10
MTDHRPQKPKGAEQPGRINRLLLAHARKHYSLSLNLIMLHNSGLNSEQNFELRGELKHQGLQLHVVRNRLTLRAFRDLGVKEAEKLFAGPTAIVEAEDPVMAAKLALEFCRKFPKKLSIIGGLVEGRVLSAQEIESLAGAMSRKELLSEIAGLILGPGRRLASVLIGPAGRLAGAVKASVEKLEKETPPPAAPFARLNLP